MSSTPPGMGIQPFDMPGSATTDANGNGIVSQIVRSAFWTVVYATCQCSGTGSWVFGPNTSVRLFGQGANVIMGPIFLAPGDKASVQVVGATPKTNMSADFWGFQAPSSEDLVGLLSSVETTGSLAAISGPVTIGGGNVNVGDGGLAAAITAAGSQWHLLTSTALTANATTTINIGSGTALPYPSGAASWRCQVQGLGAFASNGVRLFIQYMDAAGNVLWKRQNDSSQIVYSTIIGAGRLATERAQFQFTLPAGATGVTATLYTTAVPVADAWFDSSIYEPTINAHGDFTDPIGFDGVLWQSNGAVFGPSANATYRIPTYYGPVVLGIQSSQAMHGSFGESDYLNTGIRNLMNFPVSSSGAGQQNTIFWLPWLSNTLALFNDSASNNTVFAELRAIQS